jgi:hypothetical protein
MPSVSLKHLFFTESHIGVRGVKECVELYTHSPVRLHGIILN